MIESVVQVDGPWYADISELAAAADVVVRVRIDASEATLSYPDESTYSSDDPMLNPYAGTGRTPSAAEVEAMAVPATVNTAVVLDVVAGPAQVGDVVTIWEMGATLAGIDYGVAGLVPVADVEGEPVAFLMPFGSEGDYQVVGSGQGTLRPVGDGVFTSVAEGRSDLVLRPEDRGAVVAGLGG